MAQNSWQTHGPFDYESNVPNRPKRYVTLRFAGNTIKMSYFDFYLHMMNMIFMNLWSLVSGYVEQRRYVLLPTFAINHHRSFVRHLAIRYFWLLTWFCSSTYLNFDKNKFSKHKYPRLKPSALKLISYLIRYFSVKFTSGSWWTQ